MVSDKVDAVNDAVNFVFSCKRVKIEMPMLTYNHFNLTFLVTMFSFGSLRLDVQQEYAQNSWFCFGL